MQTLLLPADAPGAIKHAADLLAWGESVALPTETVYGLAADAGHPEAVAAIFTAKDRPRFDPLIVHLPGLDWLERLTTIPTEQRRLVERLAARFWPGPLTILLPRRREHVPDIVTAGSDLVAVRMSAHPVFQAVVEKFGRPLAAPSANRFGRISPTTGAHVLAELNGRIPLILDAGPTAHGLESTVVSVAAGETLGILRHGPVTAEMLGEIAHVQAETPEAAQSAPGQTPGHYAPRTFLFIWPGDEPVPAAFHLDPARVGLLAFRRDRPHDVDGFGRVEYLSEAGDLAEAAVRLFAALRRLDEAGLDVIIAVSVPEVGLGRAIMERLRRAEWGSGEGTSGGAATPTLRSYRRYADQD